MILAILNLVKTHHMFRYVTSGQLRKLCRTQDIIANRQTQRHRKIAQIIDTTTGVREDEATKQTPR